jgi:hypothetical protein
MYAPTDYAVWYLILYIPVLVALAYGVSAGTWTASCGVLVIVVALMFAGSLDHCTDDVDEFPAHFWLYRCSRTRRAALVWCADIVSLGAVGCGFYVLGKPGKPSDPVAGVAAALCDLCACSIHLYAHLVVYNRPRVLIAHYHNDLDYPES